MIDAKNSPDQHSIPEFRTIMGHPSPLWMLFMSEFWERFAFYGIRWALVLYIVAQFHGGDQSGQADANLTYGSYLALVYAGAIFGGYIADKIIGYQRSILIGATFMAAGLFMIMMPDPVMPLVLTERAIPKSMIFSCPCPLRTRFSGLMSRCCKPRWSHMKSRASAASRRSPTSSSAQV